MLQRSHLANKRSCTVVKFLKVFQIFQWLFQHLIRQVIDRLLHEDNCQLSAAIIVENEPEKKWPPSFNNR